MDLTGERSRASFLKPGDCLPELPAGGGQAVKLVDCNETHAADVFAVLVQP